MREERSQKMQCPYCQNEIKEIAKFCPKCGHKIARCPSCGQVLTTRSKFCPRDGTVLDEELLRDLPAYTPDAAAADEPTVQILPGGGNVSGPADRPEAPVRKYCRHCGKLCEPGRTICAECEKKMQTPVTPPPKRKGPVIAVVIVLLVILLAAGGFFAWQSGMLPFGSVGSSSQSAEVDDDSSAEPSSDGALSPTTDADEKEDVDEAAPTVTLDETSLTLEEGGSAVLTVSVSPEDWDGTLTWSSGDKTVATVSPETDRTASVTFVGEGACEITVTADGDASAVCSVTCQAGASYQGLTVGTTCYITAQSGIQTHGSASSNSVVTGKLPYGSEVTLTAIEEEWGAFSDQDGTSWVNLDWVATYSDDAAEYTVGAEQYDGAVLHAEADMDSDGLVRVPSGTTLTSTEVENGFLHVVYSGTDADTGKTVSNVDGYIALIWLSVTRTQTGE